ncbi:LysR family transcriptional regulator [Aurantivibrio plasticivorans]
MDIETLKIFVEVMRFRSFTQVADARRVAPSSISRSIGRLEDELGIRLFQRSPRKLEATDAGHVYYQRVAPMVDELESAKQMAVDVSAEPQGTLRVTAPPVYGQRYLVPLLPELQQRYPKLEVQLLLSDGYLDLIAERIDVAIRLGALEDSSYVGRRLCSMNFHVCASPDYLKQHGRPEIPEDLSKHECIIFPRAGSNQHWYFHNVSGATIEIPVQGRTLITNSEAVRQCVLANMGVALLPDWLIGDDLVSGRLVSLFDNLSIAATHGERAIWVLQPSRQYQPLKAQIFVNLLFEKLAQ